MCACVCIYNVTVCLWLGNTNDYINDLFSSLIFNYSYYYWCV